LHQLLLQHQTFQKQRDIKTDFSLSKLSGFNVRWSFANAALFGAKTVKDHLHLMFQPMFAFHSSNKS
jgi:hypothetical protein